MKKFNQFNESVNDYLKGPSKEEAFKELINKYVKGEISTDAYLRSCIKNDWVDKIDEYLIFCKYDSGKIKYILSEAIYENSLEVINFIISKGIGKDILKDLVKYNSGFNQTTQEIKDAIKKYLENEKI